MSIERAQRPVVLYDGECGFCKRHIARWRALSGDSIEYYPYQEAAGRFPQLDKAELARAMHLIEPDGSVTRGAEAVLRLAALSRKRPLAHWCYRHVPGFAPVADAAYRFTANHRNLIDRLDRWIFGSSHEPTSHRLTRSVFLRALGAIYLIAFISLWVQIAGLIGSDGILPIGNYLEAIRNAIPGSEKYRLFPTLCWLSSSDGFLNFLCCAGVIMSILLIAGVLPMAMLIGLWVSYLSLVVAGQHFLSFQWDILLLEAGLASIFLAPPQLLMRWRQGREPSHVALWLLRWLAFRIMFLSGMTKLVAGDPSWLDGTALTFHYWTQPLPPWTAWYVNRAPLWFSKFSCQAMFFAELWIPFLIFTPKIPRRLAFCGIALFQITIMLTGNYGFFNILTIVLCIPLLDDTFFAKRLRRDPAPYREQPAWSAWAFAAPALLLVLITSVAFARECRWAIGFPSGIVKLHDWAQPFRSANGYGLFRVMTKQRYEIVILGSDNYVDWKPYEFKWKPGDVERRPRFLIPHMPRLDWQMWFVPLNPRREEGWLGSFMQRLLEGSPSVTGLLESNPFPDRPPKLLRAFAYEYEFADPGGKAWWKRRFVGEFVPVMQLPEKRTKS